MKQLAFIIIALTFAIGIHAADKPVPGPKGGKMVDPTTEFYVDNDRKAVISFYDAELKTVAPGEQTGMVWADAKSGRVKLVLEKTGDALVSKDPLPPGDGYNVMVQLKAKPDAKFQNFKIKYLEEPCGGCQRPEYACICGHTESDDHNHEGHNHKR